MGQGIEWKCPDCDSFLGEVVGGELHPDRSNLIRTRGANLEIVCRGCGYVKVWYTNDPITRAMNQLIGVMSAEMVKTMMRQYTKARSEFSKND